MKELSLGDICVDDLLLSTKLKDNGYPQNTFYYWCKTKEDYKLNYLDKDTVDNFVVCAAPTISELLKEFPKIIEKDNKRFALALRFKLNINCYSIVYDESTFGCGKCLFYFTVSDEKHLPNVLAKMWLELKKRVLI